MHIDPTCGYCQGPEGKADVLAPVGALSHSFLYVFKDQFHRGRCVLAVTGHYEELHDLEEDVYVGFMADMKAVASAIHKLYAPDKINYGLFGDTVRHVHMHLVPKYKGSADWGAPFQMNPGSAPDEQWKEVAAQLRAELGLR